MKCHSQIKAQETQKTTRDLSSLDFSVHFNYMDLRSGQSTQMIIYDRCKDVPKFLKKNRFYILFAGQELEKNLKNLWKLIFREVNLRMWSQVLVMLKV